MANATNLTYALEKGLSIKEHWANEIIDSGLFHFYDSGNFTIDAFTVTQRVATDNTFRCVDEATVYAGAVTGTFPAAYYYDFDREINGFNPTIYQEHHSPQAIPMAIQTFHTSGFTVGTCLGYLGTSSSLSRCQ